MPAERDVILVVGAGPFQVPVFEPIRRLGYKVAALDGNPAAIGLAAADHGFAVDLRDPAACVAIARTLPLAGALTVASDIGVRAVAAINHALGLAGPTPEMAALATDKSRMRQAFAAQAIPSPRHAAVRSLAEARAALTRLGLPAVVKPSDNAGSRGVSLVTAADEFDASYDAAAVLASNGVVMVEEFMPGHEVAVDGFVHRGRLHLLAISDKIRTRPPYLLDTAVLWPSHYPAALQERVLDVARRAIAAIGIDDAPVHIEIMITPDGPKMVELAARGAGFHVFSRILPWVSGVDTLAALVQLSLGAEPEVAATRRRGAVLVFPHARPGLVTAVDGIEDARRVAGILEVEIYKRPGEHILPLTSGADRIGHIIATCETRREAETAARQAAALITVAVDSERELELAMGEPG